MRRNIYNGDDVSLPLRTSAAAHLGLAHANPLTSRQMSRLVVALSQMHPRSVLEVGCGPGTFSIELARATDARITALDINPDFLTRARKDAAAERLLGRIAFEQKSAAALGDEKYDAIVCLGSSHAFGTTQQALLKCVSLVRQGGCVLFGDLVWRRVPEAAFLDVLGARRTDYWLASDAGAILRQAGLELLHEESASPDDWRQYEEGVRRGRLHFSETLCAEEADLVRSRAESWFGIYEQYGQHVLGFAAYLGRVFPET